ncbi:hypothetical protein [Candidatus Mesenet endosymbiont of Phosphuga atrata]|uniref:hypothetical protein n=1 Tax=Candidatus Mesenet endosymbiont of Phosphuga atrata TaxID=3066221 RepID=UPI0030D50E66
MINILINSLTLIASTFLAIAAAGIACIAISHSKDKEKKSLEEKKDKEIKNLKNNPINKTIAKIKGMKKIELTLNKEGLSVTGDLDKLTFDGNGENEVMTESSEILTLTKEEEEDNEVSYRITCYKEKCSDKDSIEDKLFNENNEISKDIIVFDPDKVSELYNTVTQAAFSSVINFK